MFKIAVISVFMQKKFIHKRIANRFGGERSERCQLKTALSQMALLKIIEDCDMLNDATCESYFGWFGYYDKHASTI